MSRSRASALAVEAPGSLLRLNALAPDDALQAMQENFLDSMTDAITPSLLTRQTFHHACWIWEVTTGAWYFQAASGLAVFERL